MAKFSKSTVASCVLAAVIILVAVAIVIWNRSHQDPYADLLCPTQYPTTEQQQSSFQTFSDRYAALHPGASMSDILDARIDFYISHHCYLELERFREAAAGNADPQTMAKINTALQGIPVSETGTTSEDMPL